MAAASPPPGDQGSWQRRLTELGGSSTGKRVKDAVRLHLRQLPCLHSLLPKLRCWKRSRYQNLDQDEEGDGTEVVDKRQDINMILGRTLVKVSFLVMIGLTVLFLVRSHAGGGSAPSYDVLPTAEEEFRRDSPIVLYLAAVEILVCGACSHTAALMYRRRRHALRHPALSEGKEREAYIKVELEKDAGLERRQLYGLGFRPSTDGLECLIVEAVRPGSLLDDWNRRAAGPSPEQLLEEALGEEAPTEEAAGTEGGVEAPAPAPAEPEAAGSAAAPSRPPAVRTVGPGAAIVAVNDAAGDIGLMQAQLARPKVTLWLRSDVCHPSQLESEMMLGLGPQPQVPRPGSELPPGYPSPGEPAPVFLGRPEGSGWAEAAAEAAAAAAAAAAPRCACIGLEDEEQQVLTRWTVCAVLFGWVTMLPVLLTQPHEHRPRQQLFRQYLLKPCLFMMPVALVLWLLDCIEVLLQYELLRPYIYFGVCHFIIPGVLVFYLLQMQAADEKLVLEQRKTRLSEVGGAAPMVAEDPAPTLLKELIELNPVALVWLGASAAVPLVAASFAAPLQTERGKKAQSYVNFIYAPCAFLQVTYLWVIWRVRFIDLPRLYLAGMGLLLSVPCFLVWCFCLVCASRFGREDMMLVERQRLERAVEALASAGLAVPEAANPEAVPGAGLVDCSEAMRDGELIFTA